MTEMLEGSIVVTENIKIRFNTILLETHLSTNQMMELFFQLYHCMKMISYKNNDAICLIEKCRKYFSEFTNLHLPLSQTSHVLDDTACDTQDLATELTTSHSLQTTNSLVNESNTESTLSHSLQTTHSLVNESNTESTLSHSLQTINSLVNESNTESTLSHSLQTTNSLVNESNTESTLSHSLQRKTNSLVNESNTMMDYHTIAPKLDVLSTEKTQNDELQIEQDFTEAARNSSTRELRIRPKRSCTSSGKTKVLPKHPRRSKLKKHVINMKSVPHVKVNSGVDGGCNDDHDVDVDMSESEVGDCIRQEDVVASEGLGTEGREELEKESFGEYKCQQDQYTCKHCSYRTNKKYNLIRHARKHEPVNRQHRCFICEHTSFESEQHRDDHMINIHNLNPDTSEPCTYCGKSYTSKSGLLKHLSRHKKAKINCPHCSKVFISRFGLQKHVALKHDMTAKFRCTVCAKLYDRKVLLDEHMLKHSGQSPYACEYCKKQYATRRFYEGHLKRCQNVIGKIPALYEKKVDQFACNMCDYTSKRLFDMRRHEMRHKIDGRPTCNTCGKSYSCVSTLKEHISTCHNNMKFICCVCGKTFNSRACMNRHISKVHHKKFRHKCQICGKEFFEKLSYCDHLDSHTGTKSHVCHVCGLSYRYKPRLMVHMRKHRDYPQYQCAHCDKHYSTSDSLSQHVAAKHTRDKHWVCEFCGKNFEWNSSYTWHRKKSCPMLQKVLVPFNDETISLYTIS